LALHGCGGLVNRAGKIVARFADWGDRLAAAGVACCFPIVFSPRGLSTQCRVREREVRSSRERVADANAARHWLPNQSWAIKNRVSLDRLSNGATSSLWPCAARGGARWHADFALRWRSIGCGGCARRHGPRASRP